MGLSAPSAKRRDPREAPRKRGWYTAHTEEEMGKPGTEGEGPVKPALMHESPLWAFPWGPSENHVALASELCQ